MNQTNSQRFHDLAFDLMDDGTVKLTQTDCGEDYVITAHPEQIVFIARRLCGMSITTAEQVQDLERKLSVIADRLEKIVDADWFRNNIIKECGDGIEIIAKLDGLVDLAIEYDGGRLLPSDAQTPASKTRTQSTGNQAVTKMAVQTSQGATTNGAPYELRP